MDTHALMDVPCLKLISCPLNPPASSGHPPLPPRLSPNSTPPSTYHACLEPELKGHVLRPVRDDSELFGGQLCASPFNSPNSLVFTYLLNLHPPPPFPHRFSTSVPHSIFQLLPTQGASIVMIYGASDALLIRPRVFLLGLIGASTAKLFRLPSPQLH